MNTNPLRKTRRGTGRVKTGKNSGLLTTQNRKGPWGKGLKGAKKKGDLSGGPNRGNKQKKETFEPTALLTSKAYQGITESPHSEAKLCGLDRGKKGRKNWALPYRYLTCLLTGVKWREDGQSLVLGRGGVKK